MNLTVYIDYRIKAGALPPAWKALRARVMQENKLGSDLFTPNIKDPAEAVTTALGKLAHRARHVRFVFDPLLQRGEECYWWDEGQLSDGLPTRWTGWRKKAVLPCNGR